MAAAAAAAQGMLLPTTELRVGPHKVHAEVAATDASRARGLMGRPSLPPDHGMLFVFDAPSTTCFWMKNTPLPLSIAFIDEDGIILNLEDMRPFDESSHCPAAPFRYALEMEQGWFKSNQVAPGARVGGLPRR
ncbi:DUF192 domain-containing protein [Parapusillimonas granuli]|uniref:DUF192 domain-containing protein n=1 Tax=Parapusillimonas granuli TaxID=380911 RepID=A0A853G3S2_9BURK|nr:DUF192 domain-containing protein [Parapusillimonas granuli]MBB5217248.1 hypothetical protein [Parapusillimonas granuli]MEB2399262.1 DUF192 domain-containing protein [Alcaligenaceae bacterium]NYT50959.1 DUF192 domain-containing protein [Parapusillimonas granuli]